MNQKSTKFQHGSREVSVSVTGASEWEKSAMKRTYLDLSFTGAKLPPIESLYEVTGGGTKDATITVHGRTFGYSLGISCDSKTKRAAAVVAIEELLAVFAAPAAPAAIIAPAAPIADADLTEYPAPAESFSADGYEYEAIGFVNVGGGNPIAWSMSRNGRHIATRVIPAQLSPACVAASFAHYRDFFERSTWVAVAEESVMTKQEFFASIEPTAEEVASVAAPAGRPPRRGAAGKDPRQTPAFLARAYRLWMQHSDPAQLARDDYAAALVKSGGKYWTSDDGNHKRVYLANDLEFYDIKTGETKKI